MAYISLEKKEFSIVLFLLCAVMLLLVLGGFMAGSISGENVMKAKVIEAVTGDKSGFCAQVCSSDISKEMKLAIDGNGIR